MVSPTRFDKRPELAESGGLWMAPTLEEAEISSPVRVCMRVQWIALTMIVSGTHAPDVLQMQEEAAKKVFVKETGVQRMSKNDGVNRPIASNSTEYGYSFFKTVAWSNSLNRGCQLTERDGRQGMEWTQTRTHQNVE
jgi:hypothetical protein